MRKTASFSRPADATAYAAGDIIANSATAGLVVPLTFTADVPTGRITGCSCVVTPASSSLVITALDFDLLLFPAGLALPFADAGYPADNAAMAITAAAMRELVGVFTFSAAAWRNPAGALTAGASGYQAVAPAARAWYPLTKQALVGVVQAKGAWTPLAVVNQFDFALDIAYEQ